MIRQQSPDEILATIPGWRGASWSELSGGYNNRIYRVERDNRLGVLKIDDIERGAPFNSRVEESRVQSRAADAGLAGRVLFASERIYLTEYVEGDVWTRSNLDNHSSLEIVAGALKRLHSLPLTGRSFQPIEAATFYSRRIDTIHQKMLALCTGVIAARRQSENPCCCHNDLVVENIIATPELKFIDWEYACDNDPLFDLATLVEHHGLSIAQSRHLLEAYFDGKGADRVDRLAEQRTLYLALLWLWLASRSDVDSAELQRIGARVVTITNCF